MVAKTAPMATIEFGFFLKNSQMSRGVKTTYKPVMKLVMAAVEAIRPIVCVTYENPRTVPSRKPYFKVSPLKARTVLGFTANINKAAMVNRIARKSKTGILFMAGFITTNDAPQAIVTISNAVTARPFLFTG